MAILPKAICRFNPIFIKILVLFVTEIGNLKINMEVLQTLGSQSDPYQKG